MLDPVDETFFDVRSPYAPAASGTPNHIAHISTPMRVRIHLHIATAPVLKTSPSLNLSFSRHSRSLSRHVSTTSRLPSYSANLRYDIPPLPLDWPSAAHCTSCIPTPSHLSTSAAHTTVTYPQPSQALGGIELLVRLCAVSMNDDVIVKACRALSMLMHIEGSAEGGRSHAVSCHVRCPQPTAPKD